MKSRVSSLLIALALLLTILPIAPAQTNNSGQSAAAVNSQDWQRLRDLKTGKKIFVELKSGVVVKGKLFSLEGTRLVLSDDGNAYDLEQRDILRVYELKGRWSRARTARIGAIVGLVVGAVVGSVEEAKLERKPNRIPSDKDEIPLIAGMTLGPLAGTGIGALLGGRRRGKLLYEAK